MLIMYRDICCQAGLLFLAHTLSVLMIVYSWKISCLKLWVAQAQFNLICTAILQAVYLSVH